MVRVVVRNWRCIEDIEVDLGTVTLLIGKNSSGKSSLAYALYFLAKVVEWKDANNVLKHLYGVDLDGVVRVDGSGKRHYPIVIEVDGYRFEAHGKDRVEIPRGSPWTSSYLLPATRVALTKIMQFVVAFARELLKRPESRAALPFMYGLFELVKNVPLLPPTYFFLEDLMKLYGITQYHKVEVGDLGALIEMFSPLIVLVSYEYTDLFTNIKLPLHLAPEGFIDSIIIQRFVERAREGSLVVVEEPEIHKNPLWLIDLVKNIVRISVERKLTLVMTTHSDILLHAVAKAVEEGRISPEQVSVYYLYRDSQRVWSRARKLKVYEDGTFEELPGVEEVVSKLF